MALVLGDFVAGFSGSSLAPWIDRPPWFLTSHSDEIVEQLSKGLGGDFASADGVAVHATARIETYAVVKPPAIIGPGCFVAAGAYLRGGVWMEADVTVGPGAELKSSFVSRGAKFAHFNFVGDSILGAGVNLEAGSVVANYRNERDDKRLVIAHGGEVIDTGVETFGALIGDECRVGANAVIAPGAILPPQTIVSRLALVAQHTVG